MDKCVLKESIQILKELNEVVGSPISDEEFQELECIQDLALFSKKVDIISQKLESEL